MKKITIFLFMSIMTLGAQSQIIERHGDRYTVDGVAYSTSTSFRNNYLKPYNAELYAQYNKGYNLAVGGWGLLGTSVVISTVGAVMMFPGGHVSQIFPVWALVASVGVLATCASIPMLGVGYHRMHEAVDAYNAGKMPASQAYWSLELAPASVGLALHF